MDTLNMMLLAFILVCAVAVSLTKDLLTSLIIFMSQSLAMAVIWILLEVGAAVGAGVGAAVGAGVTSLLMFVALKKIHAIKGEGSDGKTEE